MSEQINYEQEVKEVYPNAMSKKFYGWKDYDYTVCIVVGSDNISEGRLSESSAWQSAYLTLKQKGEIK